MPSIKDKSTVEAIAREYCSNGRRKCKALETIGYSRAYSIEGGRGADVVFSNVRVKAEIARLDSSNAKAAEFTVKVAGENYDRIMKTAEKEHQLSAAVAANTGHARLYGMDKDASDDKQAVELSELKYREAKRLAQILLVKGA